MIQSNVCKDLVTSFYRSGLNDLLRNGHEDLATSFYRPCHENLVTLFYGNNKLDPVSSFNIQFRKIFLRILFALAGLFNKSIVALYNHLIVTVVFQNYQYYTILLFLAALFFLKCCLFYDTRIYKFIFMTLSEKSIEKSVEKSVK